jgi:hypothetical protein
MRTLFITILAALPISCIAAGADTIDISNTSIRVNNVEIRTGPQAGTGRYISLDAVESVLGPSREPYGAGRVAVYAWPESGFHVQEGFRGAEEGKIFKFQVYLHDTYSEIEDKHSGKFSGQVHVEGLDITSDTTFDSIRVALEKAGFEIKEYPAVVIAEKGRIRILTVGTTNEIQRVEVWCE